MFTIAQIHEAHDKVKSGADFPKYIQEIKALGVIGFETFVEDSRTQYFGLENFKTESEPMYANLEINANSNKAEFIERLKKHQRGETDYFKFCKDCAETGIEKWIVSLTEMTCIYYDKNGNEILVEQIPS
ncbi:DUF1398 domain-containing protein [Flavobacterium okayamense]|uniref:Phage envelope protein n=1 Tax=Flavobacterium okayamense TaxID=2830782 RepID=A0ABN6HW10_9FLAO|nr:DUF1398 family protein [Flavobacterium okayamense]BCY28634.1 hypothetical protein KK2020170_15020 [Flavobacterium okayamense]